MSGMAAMVMSFFGAVLLEIWPLPNELIAYRPDWVAMVVLYWAICGPRQIALALVFGLGVLLDCVYGTLLGQGAVVLLLLATAGVRLKSRFRYYNIGQQLLLVGLFLILYRIGIYWAHYSQLQGIAIGQFYLGGLSGLIFWPLLRFMDRKSTVFS